MTTITLSELLATHKQGLRSGKESGTCIFCGKTHKNGFKPTLKPNFTAHSSLHAGSIMCHFCNDLYNTQEYRKNMWVVSKTSFRTFKRSEGNKILLNPPNTPFMIYYTKTWKKQGWVNLINKTNYSKDTFVVGFDYDIICVGRKRASEHLKIIADLLDKKITKTELTTGNIYPNSYEKLDMNTKLIDKIKMLCNNPLWNLCVFLS